MRAEQRIGRIDRIGGHKVVYVRNYFYEDTVEARVYQALSKRINMFEWVVGELQPILSGVERTIQELALLRKEQRKTKIEEAIQRLNQEYDDQVAKGLKLDDYLPEELRKDTEEEPPLNLNDLEKVITQSYALKSYWENNSEFPNSWILKLDDEKIPFTFDRDMFDRYPETLRLLTYGEPILEDLLKRVRPLSHPEEVNLPFVRYAVDTPEPIVSYYALGETEVKPIRTLKDLQEFLENPPPDRGPGRKAEAYAKQQFESLIKEREEKAFEKKQIEYRSRLLGYEEQGRQLLVKAAFCDISIAREPSLFDQSPVEADFDEETVQRLRKKGYPFAPLFHLIETKGLKPEPTDPFWLKVQGKSEREIRGTHEYLRREVKKLIELLNELNKTSFEKPKTGHVSIQRFYKEVKRERPKLALVKSVPREEWFKRFLPVYSLKAAAGYFGNGEAVEPDGWVEVDSLGKLDENMFVARAVGRSMEPKIQDGDYIVFRGNPTGSRIGKIVLAQYRGPEDPETGGAYTVKKYQSEKVPDEESGWRHERIILSPLNPEFSPIVLDEEQAGSVKVIAEYVGKITE